MSTFSPPIDSFVEVAPQSNCSPQSKSVLEQQFFASSSDNFDVSQREYKSKEIRNFTSMTLLHSKNSYVNFASPKTQPIICRSSFPYFLEDDEPMPNEPKGQKQMKITNRVLIKRKQRKPLTQMKVNKIASEQPPINQFLSYDLSKDINNGLCEVKILAQEIKKIKKQKQQELEDKNKYKPNQKIVIKKITKGKPYGILGNLNSQKQNLR